LRGLRRAGARRAAVRPRARQGRGFAAVPQRHWRQARRANRPAPRRPVHRRRPATTSRN